MIAGISIVIAAYEALALITRKPPTVTRLSHTKAGVFVWLWLVSLAIHLIRGEDAAPLTPSLSAVRVRVHAPRPGRSR